MSDNLKYIFERVYVETPVDTDKDGKYDLIAVYIKRPVKTNGNLKVPCLYVANPYMMTCNEEWYKAHNVDKEIEVYPQQNIAEEEVNYDFNKKLTYDIKEERTTLGYAKSAEIKEDFELDAISELYDYFIERDYGAVFSAGLGTLGSEGITKTGSREEILAFKSVIDWLNGRTRAFTDKENNIEIKAWWSTGKVAMSAKSYLGTMCIGVAATGVEGLETVIPEAAISNWYNYYRYNGLNLPAFGWQGDDLDILSKYCFSRAKDANDFHRVKEIFEDSQEELLKGEDRKSGNYNLFWDERNYLRQVDKIKASVLIIHGLNDWNVKTNQCYPLFKELEKRNIPRKIILHQGQHIYIYNLKGANILLILERWLDHYLKGIDTGIEKEPKVLVQSNLDQSYWMKSESWQSEDNCHVFKVEDNGTFSIIDDLNASIYDREKNNTDEWLQELVLSDDIKYKNRAKYIWDLSELKNKNNEDIRFSGEASISFEAAIDRPTAILSAMIVDLGEDCRITSEIIEDQLGEFTFKLEEVPSQFKVITRGWLNAQNRGCIYSKEEIIKDRFYKYNFSFVPTDYLIRKGHKLGLIIYGIDAEATQRSNTVTKIIIKQESIKLSCPLQVESK